MEQSWIHYEVPIEWEEHAKEIRERRDKIYPNIFDEESTDLRWVGDLGEICFDDLLNQYGFNGYAWHLERAAGEPDFTVNGIRIDVKTVKRKVPPLPNYTAQITARHKDHPIDELFFISYEYQKRQVWLLGGIKMAEFLKFATYHKAGEIVHANYTIRPGHEVYNAPISRLEKPVQWLKNLR